MACPLAVSMSIIPLPLSPQPWEAVGNGNGYYNIIPAITVYFIM